MTLRIWLLRKQELEVQVCQPTTRDQVRLVNFTSKLSHERWPTSVREAGFVLGVVYDEKQHPAPATVPPGCHGQGEVGSWEVGRVGKGKRQEASGNYISMQQSDSGRKKSWEEESYKCAAMIFEQETKEI